MINYRREIDIVRQPSRAVWLFAAVWLFPQAEEKLELSMHGPLKLLSYVIALLMIIAMVYSGYISIQYWSGIGV